MQRINKILIKTLLVAGCCVPSVVAAQDTQPITVLFENVRIFDGKSDQLSVPSNVLIRDNKIASISTNPIATDRSGRTRVINGGGRTLMPGLIDAHTHLMLATVPLLVVLSNDVGYLNVAAIRAANDMLMRGFTSVRDLGGPVFGLKKGIDQGADCGATDLARGCIHFPERRARRLSPAQ